MAIPPREERTIAIYPPRPPEPSVLCFQVALLIAPVATRGVIAPMEEVAVAVMIVPEVAVVLTIRITRTKITSG